MNVLLDRGDDVAVTHRLLVLHDPPAGRIVAHPTPTSRSAGALAHDVLAALGAPASAAAENGLGWAHGAWSAARAWIAADRPEQLVVLRAHLLAPAAWTAVAALARSTGVTLVLVCHLPNVPARLHAALEHEPYRVLPDLPAALSALGWDRPASARHRSVDRRFPRLPRLPTGGVLHYRADAYRQQSGRTFAGVDALYGRGLDAACRWLRHHPGLPDSDGDADGTFQRFLTRLVYDSPTPRHALAQLRGVQAGFLLHGYWLTLPSAGTLRGPGVTSTPVTSAVADRIRAQVAHPVVAAGVAISLFTGLPAPSLRGLSVTAVRSSTRYLTISVRINMNGRVVTGTTYQKSWTRHVAFYVPPAARPLMRAARVYLGEDRRDPLVFGHVATNPRRIEEAAERCGLHLPGEPIELTACWPLQTVWGRIGEPVHDLHRDQRPAAPGRSCLTAAPTAHPAVAEPPYREPYERLHSRWASHGTPPTVVAELLRAYLTGTEVRLARLPVPPPGAPPQPSDWARRRTLVERQVAVRLPPTAAHRDRVMLHPDIAFALRLTDRPAPDSGVR